MHCGVPNRRFISRRSILAWLALSLVGCALSCATIHDWWHGDFNVRIEGAPEGVHSLFFILGKKNILEEAIASGELSTLAQASQQKLHREFEEFQPNRTTEKWEQRNRSGKQDANYHSSIDVLQPYVMIIRVHRPEFRDWPDTAIVVVVRQIDGKWDGVMIENSDFKNMDEATVSLEEGVINVSLSDDKKD